MSAQPLDEDFPAYQPLRAVPAIPAAVRRMRDYITLADQLPQANVTDSHGASTVWTEEELAMFAGYLVDDHDSDMAELTDRFATQEQTRRAAVAELASQMWPGDTSSRPARAWSE